MEEKKRSLVVWCDRVWRSFAPDVMGIESCKLLGYPSMMITGEELFLREDVLGKFMSSVHGIHG